MQIVRAFDQTIIFNPSKFFKQVEKKKKWQKTTVDFLGQTQSICVSDSTAIRILWGAPPNNILAMRNDKVEPFPLNGVFLFKEVMK